MLCSLFRLHTTILVMQALVWLDIVWFRVIPFGAVWFSASCMNLKQPHIKFKGEKNLVFHSSNYGNLTDLKTKTWYT
jgi:hypothetical protein